mmetsp:Transcript_57338/g.129913  ORF Transcript_57338/g.129913 Transcript_57338/m.129913 type:complete len:377 (-) Transcript_57338:96-1226(-)
MPLRGYSEKMGKYVDASPGFDIAEYWRHIETSEAAAYSDFIQRAPLPFEAKDASAGSRVLAAGESLGAPTRAAGLDPLSPPGERPDLSPRPFFAGPRLGAVTGAQRLASDVATVTALAAWVAVLALLCTLAALLARSRCLLAKSSPLGFWPASKPSERSSEGVAHRREDPLLPRLLHSLSTVLGMLRLAARNLLAGLHLHGGFKSQSRAVASNGQDGTHRALEDSAATKGSAAAPAYALVPAGSASVVASGDASAAVSERAVLQVLQAAFATQAKPAAGAEGSARARSWGMSRPVVRRFLRAAKGDAAAAAACLQATVILPKALRHPSHVSLSNLFLLRFRGGLDTELTFFSRTLTAWPWRRANEAYSNTTWDTAQ